MEYAVNFYFLTFLFSYIKCPCHVLIIGSSSRTLHVIVIYTLYIKAKYFHHTMEKSRIQSLSTLINLLIIPCSVYGLTVTFYVPLDS